MIKLGSQFHALRNNGTPYDANPADSIQTISAVVLPLVTHEAAQ